MINSQSVILLKSIIKEYSERVFGMSCAESGQRKKGDKLFTYYDITDPTNQGYRTAKGQYTLIAVGGNNE